MIAPEPFFQIRGTPFSIYHRLKALSKLGHRVDLVTYHLGEDVSFENVKIFRIPKVPGIRHVKIGPSLAKLPLDAVLFSVAAAFFLRRRYDAVHTHEEAAVLGALLRKIFRVPHIYDMHSSLPQQFINYNYFRFLPGIFLKAAEIVERFILKNSDAVIAICPHLREIAVNSGAGCRVDVIENVALIPARSTPELERVNRLKQELGIGKRKVVTYTGTFEYNQGLEEVIEAIPAVLEECPDTAFVLVGGEPDQVEKIRALAGDRGVAESVVLPGRKPLEQMPFYMEMSDILLSYRKIGTNTPLKLYSYLWSGRPTVATGLLVNTQVLNEDVAVLTDPSPEAFADGIIKLLKDKKLRMEMGRKAKRLAEMKYTYEIYLGKIRDLYDRIDKKNKP